MKNVHMLFVEDNEGDIILATEFFMEAQIINKVTVMRDGAQALKFLHENALTTPSNLPDLILLDINLPKINGIEVLKSIKKNEALKRIPVVVLTSSSALTDQEEAFREQAHAVITKPLDENNIFDIVKGIDHFGISLVMLPLKN